MVQTTVRITEETHEDLRKTAYDKRISINTEITLRLMGYAAMVKQVAKLTKQLEERDDL